MIRRAVLALALIWGGLAPAVWGGMALAAEDRAAQMSALLDALEPSQTIEIMQEEGLRYGAQIARDMMPDADQTSWGATVARIYDPARMEQLVRAALTERMDGVELEPLAEFFTSELGTRIIALELAARRSFLQDGMEEAAQEGLAAAEAADAPILAQIDTLISDSDLIERNVMGSLNSNLMFYRGLIDGGASDLGEADILSDVWAQEDGLRADTSQWLRGFLLMAYQPLEPSELDAYAALYRSAPGRALNAALFGGFNQMYDELSYLLGRAVADHMTSAPL